MRTGPMTPITPLIPPTTTPIPTMAHARISGEAISLPIATRGVTSPENASSVRASDY